MHAHILQPLKEETNAVYSWAGLDVRKSQIGSGNGVFATSDLSVGTMIPILGVPINEHEYDQMVLNSNRSASHFWLFQQKHLGFVGVDGKPTLNSTGLNIAMMINEDCQHKPNCAFIMDYVVVLEKVFIGQELSVYYGENYYREDYTLNKRADKCFYYSAKQRLLFPIVTIRRDNICYWLKVLCEHEQKKQKRQTKI